MKKRVALGVAWMILASHLANAANAATASRSDAGALKDGTRIEAVSLRNGNGVSARVLTYGATLQSLIAPDRHGKKADVILGQESPADYERQPNYFGVTVGRYANRIAKGRFMIDGKTFQLPLNNGANSLHGGTAGFDKKVWVIASVTSGAKASVTLSLVSPDGDMGYPGELAVSVTYALDEKNALTITFAATTTKPTVINMTNHALFNLAGDGAPGGAMGHVLTIPAARFTPVDETLIPTGELRAVKATPFDFTRARVLSAGLRDGGDQQIRMGRGYDHNFVLDKGRSAKPERAARLADPLSGRVLEVLTTEPGLQLYTGNFLDGSVAGKHGHLYRMGDGIALEPQKFPDTPNQPAFGSARVDPGKPYSHTMIYRLSVAK